MQYLTWSVVWMKIRLRTNFLTHSFNLKPGTDTWRFLQNQFEEAYKMKDVITHIPTRTQNRLHRYTPVPPADVMKNEPDTDFDLAQNQEWVRNILRSGRSHRRIHLKSFLCR